MFQDKKEIEIGGKKFVIRQRSLADIIALERCYKKYASNKTAEAVVLAKLILDAIKYDNKYWWIIPWSLKKILKSFSLNQMQQLQKEIVDLETYQVKKKTQESQAG